MQPPRGRSREAADQLCFTAAEKDYTCLQLWMNGKTSRPPAFKAQVEDACDPSAGYERHDDSPGTV